MSQYLQFRRWVRSSAPAEKALTAAVLVVVLGLIGWALVPTGSPGGNPLAVGTGGVTGGTAQSPATSAGVGGNPAQPSGAGTNRSVISTGIGGSGLPSAAGGSGGAPSSVASGGGSAGAGGSGGGGGSPLTLPGGGGGGSGSGGGPGGGGAPASCGPAGSTDTGVTSTQVRVADILLDLAGAIGNSAVEQPSPQIQQQVAQSLVTYINSHGGIDCRKLVVDFFNANPIDPTSTHNVCLQIEQDHVFAVLGGFAYPEGANDCLAQYHIPLIANISPTPSEGRQYYPYLMSTSPDPTVDYKNAIFGMRDRGFFTSAQGFQKLSILEDDCSPEINQAVYTYLIQAGVPAGAIVKDEFSCPSGGFPPPNQMSQFATQDHLNGITNVVVVTGGGSLQEYSNFAKGQSYKPKYLVSDYDGMLVTATGSTGPDPTNFDGTVATTDTRFGEYTTPGLSDATTQACIAILAKGGNPSSDVTGSYLSGGACNIFLLFADAAAHDVGLKKAGLAQGLGQVGRFPMAYPNSDSIYGEPGLTTPVKLSGGDYWWTIEFYASCTCWRVINKTEHPSY